MDKLFPPLDNLKAILDRQEAPSHGQGWRYGMPRDDGQGKAFAHDGVDLGEITGEPIRAVMDYTVIDMGRARLGGTYITLLHDGETIKQSRCCHMADFVPGMQVNDKGVAGKVIGYVGNTGASSGSHLHFILWDKAGKTIDPLPWLRASMIENPKDETAGRFFEIIPVGGLVDKKGR